MLKVQIFCGPIRMMNLLSFQSYHRHVGRCVTSYYLSINWKYVAVTSRKRLTWGLTFCMVSSFLQPNTCIIGTARLESYSLHWRDWVQKKKDFWRLFIRRVCTWSYHHINVWKIANLDGRSIFLCHTIMLDYCMPSM